MTAAAPAHGVAAGIARKAVPAGCGATPSRSVGARFKAHVGSAWGLGTAATVLAVGVLIVCPRAAAAEATSYRSTHGFTFPLPAGYVRADAADLPLAPTERAQLEAYFKRPAATEDGESSDLLVTFRPGSPGTLDGATSLEAEFKREIARAHPGTHVDEIQFRRDAATAPHRLEAEFVMRRPGDLNFLLVMILCAGRDGAAAVMFLGPEDEAAALRRDAAAVRAGLRFDSPYVHRPAESGPVWRRRPVLYIVSAILMSGLFSAIGAGWRRLKRTRRRAKAPSRRSRTPSAVPRRRPDAHDRGRPGMSADAAARPRRPGGGGDPARLRRDRGPRP